MHKNNSIINTTLLYIFIYTINTETENFMLNNATCCINTNIQDLTDEKDELSWIC